MPDRSAIALAPEGTRSWLGDAVEAGGATVVEPAEADGLVWTDPADPAGLGDAARRPPGTRLGAAAVGGHRALRRGRAGPRRAHLDVRQGRVRRAGRRARAGAGAGGAAAPRTLRRRRARWGRQAGVNLLGARVAILGGGGITESLLRLLGPFGCDVTVVRRTPAPMAGAARVVGDDQLDDALTRRPARGAGARPHPGHRGHPRPAAARAARTPTAGW